jgi:alkylation response protein AidB-like acyl-CoA dehydrogenase
LNAFVPRYDEIRFALDVWAGPPAASSLETPDGLSGDLVDAVIDEAGRFASEVLAPLDAVGDREGCRLENNRVQMPAGWPQAYRQFVDAAWNTAHFSSALGGQGLPTPVSVAISEMFNAANIAFCLGLMPFTGVVALLERFGTARQKRLYLPALVSGRWTATLAITEPQAGTDLGAIRTSAVPDQASYLIKGQKCFITYGEHDLTENILHFVLARDPSGLPGVKGLSLYIVPKFEVDDDGGLGRRNDVVCFALENKIGIHGSPTASLAFGAETGAAGERLGDANRGLEHMFLVLNRARLNIGVFGLASAERAYQAALAYAQERIQGSGPDGKPCAIIRHPDVWRMILDMRSCIDAMRAIAYYTASLVDCAAGEPDSGEQSAVRQRLDLLTPITKGWLTETAFQAASTAVQVAGGAGYINEGAIAQCFRDARVHTIYEGTTGVQASDLVLRKVVRDNGRTAFALLAQMREDALADTRAASLDELAPIMSRALEAVEAATEWAIGQGAANRRRLEAVATPYLNLWGNAIGAWLLLKGAARASCGPSAQVIPQEFSDAKKANARFFLVHRLIPASSLAEVMINGSDAILDRLPQP